MKKVSAEEWIVLCVSMGGRENVGPEDVCISGRVRKMAGCIEVKLGEAYMKGRKKRSEIGGMRKTVVHCGDTHCCITKEGIFNLKSS